MISPHVLTLAEIRDALQARRLRSSELLATTQEAIGESERQDPPLNAFISVAGPELAQRADEIDQALDG